MQCKIGNAFSFTGNTMELLSCTVSFFCKSKINICKMKKKHKMVQQEFSSTHIIHRGFEMKEKNNTNPQTI